MLPVRLPHWTAKVVPSTAQVMRFWFAIPPAEEMEQLTTLMTAAFAMVAQVDSYSISAERQKQAEQVSTP